jgi:hypothetical protein
MQTGKGKQTEGKRQRSETEDRRKRGRERGKEAK